MAWNDDLLKGLQDAAVNVSSGVTQSASDFIKNTAQSTLARIGPQPTGNPTAADIEAGNFGNAASATLKSIGGIASNPRNLVIAGVVVIAAIYLLKKKRR